MLRTILLFAWIPLIWQPTWGQAPSVGKEKAVVKPPEGRTSRDQGRNTNETGSKERPFVVDTKGHQDSKEERAEADAEKQRARDVERRTLLYAGSTAWATIALVFVGIGGIIAAICTLVSIKRQVDLQERAIRPWIGTDSIGAGSISQNGLNTEVTANVSLTNTGPSIATEGFMLPHLISSQASELPEGIKNAWTATEEALANRNKMAAWETGFVLHPTRSHNHHSVMGTKMPVSGLQAGLWWVLVCVIYRDQFGKEHRTQDCFRVRIVNYKAKFEVIPAHQRAT